MEQLFAFTVPLGDRAARPLDVGAGPRVAAVQEEDARPDADCELMLSAEIIVEARQEQLLDSRFTPRREGGRRILIAKRIRHERMAGLYMLPTPIIECIPNLSEGRRPDVVEAIAAAVRAVPGVRLLDHSSDPSHNRSVFTMAGDAGPIKAAVLAIYERAIAAIDLRTHTGEHPRFGAVDVVPFVPIEGVTMDACVALAKDVAREGASRFGVPIYLYEEASANPERRNLEDIRRGEFEGLAAKMASKGWAPDFGPAAPHVSAGAPAIRAPVPPLAPNNNPNTQPPHLAKKNAAAIPHNRGGVPHLGGPRVRPQKRSRLHGFQKPTN